MEIAGQQAWTTRPTAYPVATITNYGKGKIAGFYMDMSNAYNQFRSPIFNQLIRNLVNSLVPDPLVSVTGSNKIHVVLGKKDGRTFIHLINSSGEHFNKSILSYSELLSTGSLQIRYKSSARPTSIKLQPSGQTINFKYSDNRIEFEIPPVEVHSIVEIEL